MVSCRSRRCAESLLLSIVLLLGCTLAPRHEYELAPGRQFHPGVRSILVLPINESTETPAGLEKGQEKVFRALVDYLSSQGATVSTVGLEEYRRGLVEAAEDAMRDMRAGRTATISETVGFTELIPPLLARLDRNPDLVVVPNMVLRIAKAEGGRSITWDGVRRRKPGSRGLSDLQGQEHALSLWVAAYDPKGERIFMGYGGLDPVYKIDLDAKKMVLFEKRLENPRNIREGVCVAMHPFFGMDVDC